MRRCSDAPVSSSFFRVRDSCRRDATSAPTSSPTYSECFKRDLQRSVANGETCNGDDTQCGLKCGNSYLIDPASGLVPASDPTQTIENCIDTCFDTPGCYSTTYRNGAEEVASSTTKLAGYTTTTARQVMSGTASRSALIKMIVI